MGVSNGPVNGQDNGEMEVAAVGKTIYEIHIFIFGVNLTLNCCKGVVRGKRLIYFHIKLLDFSNKRLQ